MTPDDDRPEDLGVRLDALRAPLTRYFLRALRERTEADDLVQEVYLRIVKRGALESYDRLAAYAFQTADSVLKDRHRLRVTHLSDRHGTMEGHAFHDPQPDAERHVMARDTLRQTSILLAQLPERTRAVFVLRRLEGLSFAEIARRVGISVSAAEKNMLRATRFLVSNAQDVE